MRIVESSIEAIEDGQYRLILTLGPGEDERGEVSDSPIGSGPSGNRAVPDRIVRALIDAPDHTLTLADLHRIVGGNPGTVSRQAWTLATNAPDLQIRLRGWVFSPDRGRYSLTAPAIREIGLTS
jgi:hypothetical protein